MTRALRILLILLATAALLLAAEWSRERLTSRTTDLRQFDPHAVGRLDTDMWRSYYERRPTLLFRQLITLLRTQYGMPPLQAVQNAYRAAHAAFVFKDGRSRAEYEQALPDLEAYYRDIAAGSARPFDARRAAALELEWWIVHRDQRDRLPAALSAAQAEVYGVPEDRFAEYARLRTEAMDLRDRQGAAITEAEWQRIGRLLDESWTSLYAAVNRE